MTRDEIVTALRCCTAIYAMCNDCPCHHKNGCEDLAKSAAADLIEKLAADRKALLNELCQYCGKYKQAHEGACDGCRWREM